MAKLDLEKFNKYLGTDNEKHQEMIVCYGTLEEARKIYKFEDGLFFETVEEMKDYIHVYGFELDGRWYHILFDEALDVIDR